MKQTIFGFVLGLVTIVVLAASTNFDRLVLGSGNYGEDPNPTADITLQNDEYISNYIDGTIDFGAANLLTTGTLGAGAATLTSISAHTIVGSITQTDSSTSLILKASDGKKWRLKVNTAGVLSADSTGLN